MKIPFTVEQFLGVFKDYNISVFPFQIILNIAAILCIFFILKKSESRIFVFYFLGFLWLWMGVVYHILFFSLINPAAYLFGGIFIIQGFLFLNFAIRQKAVFNISLSKRSVAAVTLLVYSLIIYPLVGYIWGHGYPYSPTFGLPCPTTIYTFGILLFIKEKIPVWLIIIPLIWSVIGFSAALTLGIYEDTGLIIAGVTTVILLKKKT